MVRRLSWQMMMLLSRLYKYFYYAVSLKFISSAYASSILSTITLIMSSSFMVIKGSAGVRRQGTGVGYLETPLGGACEANETTQKLLGRFLKSNRLSRSCQYLQDTLTPCCY